MTEAPWHHGDDPESALEWQQDADPAAREAVGEIWDALASVSPQGIALAWMNAQGILKAAIRGAIPPPPPSVPGPPTPQQASTELPSDEMVALAQQWLAERGFLDQFEQALTATLPRLYARAWSDATAQARQLVAQHVTEPGAGQQGSPPGRRKAKRKAKKAKRKAKKQPLPVTQPQPPPPAPPPVMSSAQLLATLLATDAAFGAWLTQSALGAEVALIVGSLSGRVATILATAAAQGWSVQRLSDALERAFVTRWRAEMIAATEAARAATSAMIAVYKSFGIKWVRWVTRHDGRVCAVCRRNEAAGTILLGKPFPSGDLWPPAHPRCVLGSTRVRAAGHVMASTVRDYIGEIVTIQTARGYELSVTPNHPIATSGGWVSASELRVGGDVLSSEAAEWKSPPIDPDEDHVPARIENIAQSLPVMFPPMPVAAEDFDGDGVGSDIYVVRTDGLLMDSAHAINPEKVSEILLHWRSIPVHQPLTLDAKSPGEEEFGTLRLASHSGVRSRGKLSPARGTELPHAQGVSLAAPPWADSRLEEPVSDRSPADAEDFCQRILALAGGIASDQIVSIKRDIISTQVYNLETTEGWYIGNGIVTHNCRCYLVPSSLFRMLIGKGAGPLAGEREVPAEEVYQHLLKNYPPKAIEWVKEMPWVTADVPHELIDYDDVDKWNAHHQPNRVAALAAREADGEDLSRAVMVDEPSAKKIMVVDGHHHTLAWKKNGKPAKAYVGRATEDNGPWLETHSFQFRDDDPHGSGYHAKDLPKKEKPRASGIMVVAGDTGRVLMLQRRLNDDKKASGQWEFPGGRLDEGEVPLEAAIREWCEETGCLLPDGKLTGAWISGDGGKYRGYVLRVPREADIDIHGGRDEVLDPDHPDGPPESLAWFDLDLLDDNPSVREEIRDDLDDIRAAASKAAKVSKRSVNYRDATEQGKRCGTCSMFLASQSACTLVTGRILAGDVCDEWEAASDADLTKASRGQTSAEILREYWTGEGHPGPTRFRLEREIRWGEPDDWYRCVDKLTPYIGEGAKGYCNLRHHEVLGYWPAQHARMEDDG